MKVAQMEPEICPQCGRVPSIMPTLFNTYYVVCAGHCETKGCATRTEAVDLWNRREYEEQELQCAPSTPHR